MICLLGASNPPRSLASHSVAKHGLEPIIDSRSRILILGTLPGDESLRLKQYYAHLGNQFWKILAGVYGVDIAADYWARISFLLDKRLALWDVLCSARRHGSADSAISGARPNDFQALLSAVPHLKAIGFNGRAAQRLFRKHVVRRGMIVADRYRFGVLPSSSSMPGRHVLPLDQKIARWRTFLLDPGST